MVKFAVRLLWLVPVLWTGVALSQSDEIDRQAQAKLDEAQTAALDANDQPFLKMSKVLIKVAIDKAAENAANQAANSP